MTQFLLLNPVENALIFHRPNETHRNDKISDIEIAKLENTSTALLIKDLLNRKQIKIANPQQFSKEIDILKSKKSVISCHITTHLITDQSKFVFIFNLFFGPYHHNTLHTQSSDEHKFDCNKYEKVYYYYQFTVARTHLKLINDFILDSQCSYFANKPYPFVLENTVKSRTDKINTDMCDEDRYVLRPMIPKGKTLFRKKADCESAEKHAMYLETVFSSIPLRLSDYLYDLLKIDTSLKKLLRHSAYTKWKALHNIANKAFIQNPFTLTKKRGSEHTFHSVFIVQRPILTNSAFKKNISFAHWALKFEGNNNLLTIEFFDETDSDHGVIKMRIMPNSSLHRRVFWYWWGEEQTQNHCNYYFTEQWQVISRIWLNNISAELIGKMVIRWLQTKDYAIYQMAKNNCQHFVRDLVSALDIAQAKKLNALFDHKVVMALLPTSSIADVLTEEFRMYEIRDILVDEINEYHKEVSSRNNAVIETTDVISESLTQNLDLIALFFIKEDKDRMSAYLEKELSNEWSEYVTVVCDFINSENNCLPCLEIINELKSGKNNVLMNALSELSDYKRFMQLLSQIFAKYELDNENESESGQEWCQYLLENQTTDPLHCPMYFGMKENYEWTMENLTHLQNYTHYKDEMKEKPNCRHKQKCFSYIRVVKQGTNAKLNDLCHIQLYKH